MNTKRCTVKPTPEPPPPDPCKLQRIHQLQKAGVKICPFKPVEPPPPIPECVGICIEKINNPTVTVTNQPLVCIVERKTPSTARCDAIEDLTAAHPELPWPGCQPPPPPPPPPVPNLCEIQERNRKVQECKERKKRYYE